MQTGTFLIVDSFTGTVQTFLHKDSESLLASQIYIQPDCKLAHLRQYLREKLCGSTTRWHGDHTLPL
jgi:hypothetical protein